MVFSKYLLIIINATFFLGVLAYSDVVLYLDIFFLLPTICLLFTTDDKLFFSKEKFLKFGEGFIMFCLVLLFIIIMLDVCMIVSVFTSFSQILVFLFSPIYIRHTLLIIPSCYIITYLTNFFGLIYWLYEYDRNKDIRFFDLLMFLVIMSSFFSWHYYLDIYLTTYDVFI